MAGLREMAGGVAPVMGGGNPGSHEGGGGEGDDPTPGDIDPKRMFNELRMTKRLLAKKDKEMEALNARFATLDPLTKQMQQMRELFGAPIPETNDGEDEPSAYELTLAQHNRYLEQNPESGGMPLTLKTAKEATDGYKLASQLKKQLEETQKKLERYENPMHTAEQMLFVNLEGGLREQVAELYGSEDNYSTFEQVAIKKIGELRKDPIQWRNFVRSPTLQAKFMKDVVESQIPRAYGKRGSVGMSGDEYTLDQAKADNALAFSMKPNDPRRASLLKKSRQKLLPEMLGLDFGQFKG